MSLQTDFLELMDEVNRYLIEDGYDKVEQTMDVIEIKRSYGGAEIVFRLRDEQKFENKKSFDAYTKSVKARIEGDHLSFTKKVQTALGGRRWGLSFGPRNDYSPAVVLQTFITNKNAKSKKVTFMKNVHKGYDKNGKRKFVKREFETTKPPNMAQLFDYNKPIKREIYLRNCLNRHGLDKFSVFMSLYLIGSNFKATTYERMQALFDYIADKSIGRITWDNVGGMGLAKRTIERSTVLIDENPQYFEGETRDHILLVGPPGVGKTLLIKAMYARLRKKVNFITYSAAVRVMGTGDEDDRTSGLESLLEGINEFSKETNRWTYLFIDEIDVIAREQRQAKALLRQMDNFGMRNFSIIASTNRPDVMDFALFRPGRFSPLIYVGKPEDEERRQIWGVVNEKYGLRLTKKQLDTLNDKSKEFTGADIDHLMQQTHREGLFCKAEGSKFSKFGFLSNLVDNSTKQFTTRNRNWETRVKKFISGTESAVEGVQYQ